MCLISITKIVCLKITCLTHLPLVLHIYISESGQHWFRQWVVTYSAPSRYLNQCSVIVNCTLRNKLQWNFNQNTKIFSHEIAFEIIVCDMAAILFRGKWVNPLCQADLSEGKSKYKTVIFRKHIPKCYLQNGKHLINASTCWYCSPIWGTRGRWVKA